MRKVQFDDNPEFMFNNRFIQKSLIIATETSTTYEGLDKFEQKPVIIKKMGFTTRQKAENLNALYNFFQNEPFIPKLLWSQLDVNNLTLIFEAKGKSLDELFEEREKKFSNLCIFYLAEKMINLLYKLHSHGVIHGNIKPSKFLVDQEDANSENLYLNALDKAEILNQAIVADGAAEKRVKLRVKLEHNKFTSLAAHYGNPLGFRDDLESLGYVILYFLRMGKMFNKKMIEKYDNKIRFFIDFKLKTSIEELCVGLPNEVTEYFRYVKRLKPQETPDYEYMKGLFLKLCQKIYIKGDQLLLLDWLVVAPTESIRYRSKALNQLFAVQQKLKRKKTKKGISVLKDGEDLEKNSDPEKDKDANSDFYKNPIFETNREQNTRISIISTHRSEHDVKGESEVPITVRKKIGDQVFVSKYSHPRFSKLASNSPSTDTTDSYKDATAETVQTHRYPVLNKELKERIDLMKDSDDSYEDDEQAEEMKQNDSDDDIDCIDFEGEPGGYYELINSARETFAHSNPSDLLASIKSKPLKLMPR